MCQPGRLLPVVAALIAVSVSLAYAQQPADPPAPEPPPAQAAPAESSWFHPFAIFVVNANVNTKGLLPGSFGIFALPDTNLTHREQFNISPGNSMFGAVFVFPDVNETKITAKVDANLRGTTPLDAQNLLQFLFFDAYIQLKTGNFTLLAGQAADVVSPLIPTTLNEFPASYVPGSIGYVRPQIRVEQSFAAGSDDAVTLQAALTQAVQTFKVSGEAFATQSGWPDVQMRAAFGHGAPGAEGKRPVEFGASGHFGERHLYLSPTQDYFRNTYSFGVDGRAQITKKTKVQGEVLHGPGARRLRRRHPPELRSDDRAAGRRAGLLAGGGAGPERRHAAACRLRAGQRRGGKARADPAAHPERDVLHQRHARLLEGADGRG